MSVLLCLLTGCGGGSSSASSTNPATIDSQPSSVNVVAGAAASFTAAASGDGLTYQWQLSSDSGSTWADIANANAPTYTIASSDASLNGSEYRVVVAGTAGPPVISSAAMLTVSPIAAPPVITVQPADQSAAAGTTAIFSVTAAGTSLTYQWQSSQDGSTWTMVAGATGPTLTLVAITAADNGKQLRAIVSNGEADVASSAAHLVVTAASPAPHFIGQPADISVVAPQAAVFSAVAAGNPAPSYQWQTSNDGSSFADIPQATQASYTTPPTSAADNGKYFRVKAVNAGGSALSASARLSVGAGVAPAISAGPTDQTAYAPANDFVARTATFSVAATGTPTPTYQWQISVDGGQTFSNINGATARNYVTPNVVLADNGSQFRVAVSNAVGSVSSHPARLNVANIGTGGIGGGLAIRPNGDILATVNNADLSNAPTTSALNGVRVVSAGNVTTLAGSNDYGEVDGTGAAARFYIPEGIALDAAGNAYVSDGGFRIRKVTPAGEVTTFAGSDPAGGFINGNGTQASFHWPYGVAIDAAGNLFIADSGNSAIRKITPSADVTTFAGGSNGLADGTGTAAQFNEPRGLAFDATGNLYVTEPFSCRIRKISPAAVVTTIAGAAGCSTGSTVVDGPIATATFDGPSGIVVNTAGEIYVTDAGSLRKISPAGIVSTVAPPAPPPLPADTSIARFAMPGITADSSGNVYVAEFWTTAYYPAGVGFLNSTYSYPIRKIAPDGTATYLP